MIEKIKIKNYKSIQSLELELGRLNIFIGENGCGKTNILEAAGVGIAGLNDKIDDEYLVARGIRVTEAQFMHSAFDKKENNKDVEIEFALSSEVKRAWSFNFSTRKSEYAEAKKAKIKQMLSEMFKHRSDSTILSLDEEQRMVLKLFNAMQPLNDEIIKDFNVYAPENTFLRRFEDEGQRKPLGIRGEGLFKHLTELLEKKPKAFAEIRQYLELLDWYDDFEIPNNLGMNEKRLKIKDCYLDDELQYFDQRSANEGFLYLLFYFVLFVSDETPAFFAIDNIDNALNPKLGRKLIQLLATLAQKYKKQVLLTTHNPALLDGLNLQDNDQRLFVVRRNIQGKTIADRVKYHEPPTGAETVRLSEQFLRGYIGGLPNNF